MDNLLEAIQKKYSVTVLTRDKTQLAHYQMERFKSLNVPEKPLAFDEIAEDCTLFIGAGGSMTREFAILGIPTISVYQDELLEVDKFLIQKGLMQHKPDLNEEDIAEMIEGLQDKNPDLELMEKGRKAYHFIKEEILKYKKHG